MPLSQPAGHRAQRSNGRGTTRAGRKAIACAIDTLESRLLFSGETLSTTIAPVLANVSNPSANAITLDNYFSDSTIPGTLATFDTSLGTITVALTDAATPLTVANFLSYVSSGAYTDTIFHRAAYIASTSGPNDIIQGGGYVVSGQSFVHIPTKSPVQDEYTTELYGDVAGTLAMAKTSSANSATSEWYFNVNNNTSLDTPTTDSSGTTTSYTVFGKVLTGMNVIDEIASLPTYNVSTTLTTVPVVGLNANEVKAKFPITAANLVYTDSITSEPGTNYTVTSSNPALVTPVVTNGVLSFTYASGLSGTANITVEAKNLDGTNASTTFAVTVPNAAAPSEGPTVAAVTAPDVIAGTSGTFSVLTNATDSVAALNASSVAIVTQPLHGTATVNSSTGFVTYTPASGYTGADTLTYTVTDTAGTVSSPATVTLDVVAKPVTVTIGTKTARSLVFTQPNGVIGTLKVTGGTALITFASSVVTTDTTNTVVTASGAGATIASIAITDSSPAASLTLTVTNGSAVSIGSITDTGRVSLLGLPNATLLGDASFASIGRLVLAGAIDSTLTLGDAASTTVLISNATDTSLIDTGSIASITSSEWLNNNGGYYTVSTPRLGRLVVTSTFADSLNVTSASSSLAAASVGQVSAPWTVAGAIGRAGFGSAVSTWSLVANGSIGTLDIASGLTSNISAGSIGTVDISGATTGSTINTTATEPRIGRLVFGGAVSSSYVTVASNGSIGSVTALSFTNSNVSAGSIGAVLVAGNAVTAEFTTSGTALAGHLQIGQFKVGGNFNGSTVSAVGAIGPFTAASLDNGTVDGGSIRSVNVSGDSTGTNFSTNSNHSSGKQIELFRIGGAFNSSSVTSAGGIGAISMLSVDGSQFTAASLGSVFVPGLVNDGTFTTNANFSAGLQIGLLKFGGTVQGSLIDAAGNIGTVSAASLTGVQIYAGVSSAESEAASFPNTATDFIATAHIGSVLLGKTGTAFSNSIISADTIGTTRLGSINTSNSGITEGIATLKLNVFSGTLVPGGVLNAGPKQLKSAATLSAYETREKVTLGDFEISLI